MARCAEAETGIDIPEASGAFFYLFKWQWLETCLINTEHVFCLLTMILRKLTASAVIHFGFLLQSSLGIALWHRNAAQDYFYYLWLVLGEVVPNPFLTIPGFYLWSWFHIYICMWEREWDCIVYIYRMCLRPDLRCGE